LDVFVREEYFFLSGKKPERSQPVMFRGESERFAKFTKRARNVLHQAQEESRRMLKQYIGSEHLLLGLLRESEGVGARVLLSLGVELERAREVVERLTEQSEQERVGEIGLTSDGKQVIERAVEEARRLNHHYVGTEHLLLALVHVQESMAARALQEMGLDEAQIRAQTMRTLSRSSEAHSSASVQSAERSPIQMWLWRRKDRFEREDQDRFDRFNEHARRVLSLAQEEAQRFQHNYIGTEHLLLALVRLKESTAGQIFSEMGIELERVRSAVEFIIGRGDRIVLGEIGLTPRAKKVIELAIDEARRQEHHYIGTEHLLLGLVREGEGIAAGVLESMGLDLEKVRQVTLRVVGRGQPLVRLAAQYMRGEIEREPRVSSVQDADDLVPEPAGEEDRGNFFTTRARRVLLRARAEAARYGRERVGTEHLLLALIREQNGIAFHVLRNLDIPLERIQAATDFLITQENLVEPGVADDFTDDCRKALELALDEAQLLEHTVIGTEHLLLGLLASEGVASGILITRGLTLEKARKEARRLLGL
jgi:ATP-dependent Clp protease ATP-binding subunit ClpA